MGRAPCCEKMGLKKGPWTPEEDQILVTYIRLNGHSNWRALPKQAGLLRCGKSCRLRWTNYLRPDIKRGNFTQEEEETIINLHEALGNRWSTIAARLPGRTDNEIKNVWHTHLKKRLPKQTHQDNGSTMATATATTTAATTTVNAAVVPTKKRARKAKATKKGRVPEKALMKQEKCIEPDDENDGTNSNAVARPTIPIKSEPVSPQPCTSEVSTVTSASENDNSSKENVGEQEACFGDFPEINDDFWMEVLSIEDTAMSTEDLPCASQCDPSISQDLLASEPMFEANSSAHGEDMDVFWYNLLTKSDDLPEITEMM